ncbi:MAG: peptide/nickel transport system substrate-binding protein [Elusimicrobia bacterium]|nr:MAG: peptide/nickel transport system substrate-binding protein [Elusimicrobiota bacterium]KAF0157462.1 MAG: peptide/nickel transport system substrate-binding protein [Elusimicrobiota bacterium]
MKLKNKLVLAALAILLAAAAYFAARSRPAGPAQPPDSPAAKVYNGILDMEPPDAALAPGKILEVHSIRLARQVYSSILAYDDSFNITGDLASGWEISPDGRAYRFTLKENVFFHDGARMTVDDVVASLKRLGEPDSTQKGLWSFVKKVERIDEKSFVIKLKSRFPPFLDFLTTVYAAVSKAGVKSASGAVIGTGPYQIAVWEPKKVVRLKRNSLYYGVRPKIDEINFYIPSAPAGIGGLAKKFVLHDLGWYNPPVDRSEAGNYTEMDIPSLQVSLLCLNISKPPFSNPAFRKAFVRAFDKKEFIGQISPGARMASGYLPLGLLGHNPEIPVNYFDGGAGAATLAKYRRKIAVVAGINTKSDHAREGAYFRDTYAKFGLDVSVVYLPDDEYLKTFLNGSYDVIKISNEADFPDAYGMLAYFTGSHPMTFLRGGDKKIDEMLVKAMGHLDRGARAATYGEVDRYIVDNHYAIPLYYNTNRRRFHNSLKGIRPSLMGEHLFSIAKLDIHD